MKKGSTGAFLQIKQQEPSRRRLHRQLQWVLVFTRPRHRNFAFGFRNVARVLARNALAQKFTLSVQSLTTYGIIALFFCG